MVDGGTQPSRNTTARSGVLVALMFLFPGSALALDPSLDVSQYAHTAWRVRDGFVQGTINAFAQTPDGYLWLGTDSGLLRFDGVRAVPWQGAGQKLPSDVITDLLAVRDGTLWIGTSKGIASWKEGKLRQYPEVAGRFITWFLQDRSGTIWFGSFGPDSLCALQGGKAQCEGDRTFGGGIIALYEDRLGTLWVSALTGLWRWKPEPSVQYHFPSPTREANGLIEDHDGALLLATDEGLKRLAGGKIESHSLPGLSASSRPNGFLRSSDGSLWIGSSDGLFHFHQGRTDVFRVADGLSGQQVTRIFEDREGSIWVATTGGFDRFHDYVFPSISVNQGLSRSDSWAVQATPDGSIWIAGSGGLNRYRDGHITFHGKPHGSPRSERSVAPTGGAVPTLDAVPQSLGVDEHGRLWTATKGGVFNLESDQFVRVPALPGGTLLSIAPDRHGSAWVAGDKGLFHWLGADDVQELPWAQFEKKSGATALLPDPVQGGVWLGFYTGGVTHLREGRILASYTPANGLGTGAVSHLRFGPDGTVWAATEGGLSRIRDGQVLTLTAKNGLPCDAAHWSVEADDRSIWLYMRCGLLHVSRSELDAWEKTPTRTIQARIFDASEGVRRIGYLGVYGPHVTRASDGRIWFTQAEAVTVIDPRHVPWNNLPPPVHIEQMTVDDSVYSAAAPGLGRLKLPPRAHDLTIDYTALSLVAPEKVRFRMKLEGYETHWRELVNERHVRYTNLPPGDYRFRVMASNNSGVWNEEGAALAFIIPPAFYQTLWFRTLCATALAGLLWGAYLVRVGALERSRRILERHEAEITALNDRLMKAQEEERSRIAGELHDGVLQELTTASLNLGTIKYQVPPDSAVKTEIAGVQQHLIDLGKDIRQLSHELHPAILQDSGLPVALASYCDEFRKTRGIPVSCEVDSTVTELSRGTSLALYRVAQEAMGNAAKHAKPRNIDVRLVRVDGLVRLSVSDDGSGFVVERRPGSSGLGLVNMRERMRSLGGRLEIESQPGRGTVVRAEVPFRTR